MASEPARMLYILLSAGSGTRMGPLTSDRAKVLVEVDGRPILDHNLRAITAVDPDAEILIVAGYAAESVERFVATAPARARVIVNEGFATAGPLRSIAVALASLPADVAAVTVGNGDTIFEPPALQALIGADGPACLLASPPEECDEDDVQIGLDERGAIGVAAKQLAPMGALPISAGLLRIVGPDALARLADAVAAGLAQEQAEGRMLTWHSLVARLNALAPVPVMVPRAWWWEFDSQASLDRYSAARAGMRPE